jgi:hypothetical protein
LYPLGFTFGTRIRGGEGIPQSTWVRTPKYVGAYTEVRGCGLPRKTAFSGAQGCFGPPVCRSTK